MSPCWNMKASKEHKLDTSLLFDSGQETQIDDGDDDNDNDDDDGV